MANVSLAVRREIFGKPHVPVVGELSLLPHSEQIYLRHESHSVERVESRLARHARVSHGVVAYGFEPRQLVLLCGGYALRAEYAVV